MKFGGWTSLIKGFLYDRGVDLAQPDSLSGKGGGRGDRESGKVPAPRMTRDQSDCIFIYGITT